MFMERIVIWHQLQQYPDDESEEDWVTSTLVKFIPYAFSVTYHVLPASMRRPIVINMYFEDWKATLVVHQLVQRPKQVRKTDHVSIQKAHARVIESGYGIKGSNPPIQLVRRDGGQ